MAKALNFNNMKKHYLTITLADENETTLMIGMPTKQIMDDLKALQTGIDAIKENEEDDETTDEVYYACAQIMSRNKGGIKITKEFLEKIFDYEDIIIFFNAYTDFVTEVASAKN